MTLMYDPPLGWMYGFPKPYEPQLVLETRKETLRETLIRDGYPEFELARITREDGSLIGVRFFGTREEVEGAPSG